MKLALGTVQFGIQYGISNVEGIPTDQALSSILDIAQKSGISILDTAHAYGNSEERLGLLAPKTFHLVTKFNAIQTATDLQVSLKKSLESLKVNYLYGYLAHNANNLIETPDLWKVLQEEKENGLIHKIGYSLYEPLQLEKLLDLGMVPDLVQIPYSILDRKFESHLPLLHKLGTEVHVRSAFLQGLYFMNPQQLPEKLIPMKKVLQQFHELCNDSGKSAAEVALNYVNANPFVDQVVIGVVTASQLYDNIEMITSWDNPKEIFENIKTITIEHKELLNPVNW